MQFKKICASLVLSGFLANSFAASVLIYNYQADGDEAVGLANRFTALGHTPTTENISSTYSTLAPTNLSTYSQVWDLGANRVISSGLVSAYTTYLQGGGTLFLMGENTGFGATRNTAIQTFVGTTLGGGALAITNPITNTQTVASQFRIVNSNTTVDFPASAKFSSFGTGTCITSDCSAVAWGVGTLANAPLGTVISVLDVNFLQTSYHSISLNGTSDFTDNLIGYLAQQAQIAQLVIQGGSINLDPNAYALRSVYNIQSAALNAGLSYDCTVFDKEGLCLSTGGRYSTTNSPNATSTSGLLIGSYKYDKNIRLGAWVDQNISTNNADGVKLGNSKPMLGVFGVWSERNDGLGYEVKVSAGYGDKDIEVTRTSTNQGSSKMNSRGIQSVSSYGIALDSNWIASPYVGVKYLSVKRGAYTEGGADALTYNNLRQETTSAIAGVKFTGKINPQTFTVLSAGVEHDLNHNIGKYSAYDTNLSATTTAFNSKPQKTRPVVSAGVYYDIDKTQRVGLNATYRQEAFQSTATTSALATYTVGF